jgi:hypothetical protein
MRQRKGETEMKRIIILHLAIAATMLLAVAQPAFAANGKAPDGGCQVGAHNEIVGEWQLFDQGDFVKYLMAKPFDYSLKRATDRAVEVWAFCDHNNDGFACVMEQNLPNDASGSSSFALVEDNHPFGGR